MQERYNGVPAALMPLHANGNCMSTGAPPTGLHKGKGYAFCIDTPSDLVQCLQHDGYSVPKPEGINTGT